MNTTHRFGIVLAGSFLAALLGGAEAARCSDNLVFVPLTPCRVIDTRVSGAGGPLTAGKPRSFVLRGPRRNYQDPAPFPNQGGKTTGCTQAVSISPGRYGFALGFDDVTSART